MIILGLSPKTKKLIREAFKGKVCCNCSDPAERLIVVRRNGKIDVDMFYCQECYNPTTYDTVEFKERKVISHPYYHPKRKVITDV
jgi:hypothetical protein